jgi:glycosyltransferase involved in cell wall biosynthesis
MTPILSICILTYNRPDYLKQLLDSIFILEEHYLNQIEILVMNNGGTSEIDKIIDLYSKRHKLIFENVSENLRGSSGYLKFFAKANGEFLIFPGDDDVFKINPLVEAIEFLSKYGKNYSVVAFGADTINESGKSNLFRYRPPSRYSREQIAAKLLFDSVFWMPCTIVKKTLFQSKIDPLSITAFDWWMWINAVANGEIKFFDLELISYRQHDGQEQKSYLKVNWELDSLLMLNKELDSDFGRYLCELQNKNRFIFLAQLKDEIAKIVFDQFQIIKWTLILTKISEFIDSPSLLKSISKPEKIWNDLRFVECWFNQKLSTEEILSFFKYQEIDVRVSTLSEGESYLRDISNHELIYEKSPVLRLYSQPNLINFQFILVFQQNNEILKFSGSSEDALQSNLKSIFGLAVREYREAETFNQITHFESKVLRFVRSLKGSKFANLIKSRR